LRGGAVAFIYQGPDMLRLMQKRDSSENTMAQYTMSLGLESMRRVSDGDMSAGTSSLVDYDHLGST